MVFAILEGDSDEGCDNPLFLQVKRELCHHRTYSPVSGMPQVVARIPVPAAVRRGQHRAGECCLPFPSSARPFAIWLIIRVFPEKTFLLSAGADTCQQAGVGEGSGIVTFAGLFHALLSGVENPDSLMLVLSREAMWEYGAGTGYHRSDQLLPEKMV
ncbi:MAG: hypothetical protein Q4D19_11265, partial [Lautropia sp.]|nr:hypothetical protein [Lautropia sp.]